MIFARLITQKGLNQYFLQLIMYRYGSNRSSNNDVPFSPARSTTRSFHSINVIPKSNFQQGRMLIMILRTKFHRTLKYSFNHLKTTRNKSFSKLTAIQKYQMNLLRTVWQDMRIFGQRRKIEDGIKRLGQVNVQAIACKYISKLYERKNRQTFNKIKGCAYFSSTRQQQIQRVFQDLYEIFMRTGGRAGLTKIIKKSQQTQSIPIKVDHISNIFDRLKRKLLIQTTQTILQVLSKRRDSQLKQQLNIKKKEVSQCENNRASILTNQRQNLQKLKKTIDSNAIQKYQVMGQMKRGKAIKVGEERAIIRNLQQELAKLIFQAQKNQRICENLGMFGEDRRQLRSLANKGKGAQQKVKQMYILLSNQTEKSSPTMRSISSSKFITMVKEKFKQTLSVNSNPQINSFKNGNPYAVYINVYRRNLINLYENVPLETLKVSQSYERACLENQSLKQLMGSVIYYQLLSIGLQKQLQTDMSELESQVHAMLDEESGQKQQVQSNIRDSVMSYTSKSVGGRRREFGKTSTMSMRNPW